MVLLFLIPCRQVASTGAPRLSDRTRRGLSPPRTGRQDKGVPVSEGYALLLACSDVDSRLEVPPLYVVAHAAGLYHRGNCNRSNMAGAVIMAREVIAAGRAGRTGGSGGRRNCVSGLTCRFHDPEPSLSEPLR